jgi:DNA repair protein RadC
MKSSPVTPKRIFTANVFKLKLIKAGSPIETIVSNSKIAYELIKPYFHEYMLTKEAMYVLYLNRSNKVIGIELHSLGSISGTTFDPILALKGAIDLLATSIILSHNHPSGSLKPSQIDIRMTKEFSQACKFMNIELMDHLIITDKNYCSLADIGEM